MCKSELNNPWLQTTMNVYGMFSISCCLKATPSGTFLKILGKLFGWHWSWSTSSMYCCISSCARIAILWRIHADTISLTMDSGLCTVISLNRRNRPKARSTTCLEDDTALLKRRWIIVKCPLSLKGGINHVRTGYALSPMLKWFCSNSLPSSALMYNS